MADRFEQLEHCSLSPQLLALSRGALPHPAFASKCQPIRVDLRRNVFDFRLNEVQDVGPFGKRSTIAMWENDFGDGHSFEVMYCKCMSEKLEFWNVLFADDTDGPDPELVAVSEQGLYFWLFFYLIPAEYFKHRTNQDAFDALSAAAASVHFRYLSDVMKFEEEYGTDENSRTLICQRSIAIVT